MSELRHRPRTRRRAALALCAVALCLLAISLLAGGSPAASPTIYTFPIPGSRLATPQTQISFRGAQVPLSAVSVSGSQSGAHSGTMLVHSDGRGSSFVPTTAFTPGETVTVTGPPNVFGSSNGVFHFTVADSPAPEPCAGHVNAPRSAGDVLHFHSRPALVPANVQVVKSSPGTALGDLFIAPGAGPVQSGPMIVGPRGGLIWFRPLTGDTWASDFRVQHYQGKPVLTWWEGCNHGGGHDLIYDSSYRQVAEVNAGNGLRADLHEFNITPSGTALITAYHPVYWNVTTAHGIQRQVVLDGVVQEIDIRSCQVDPTCLVLFQWDSLDHVPVSDAEASGPSGPGDYFHVNSVEEDKDGQLVIDSRNTFAAYKVDHNTGKIIWRLGGKHSSFKFGPGAKFAFQHDVRVHANDDEFITLFDDEAGPPALSSQSRGLKLKLDLKHMTANLATQYLHKNPPLLAYVMGNVQQLPNFNIFVGWGPGGYFSEYERNGTLLFDARFVGPGNLTYRAFRFPWTGRPQGPPDIAASNSGSTTSVYASWNGATEVASWRVLGGSSPATLHAVKTVHKRGFETAMGVSKQGYVSVQALDSSGHVLGQSKTVSPS